MSNYKSGTTSLGFNRGIISSFAGSDYCISGGSRGRHAGVHVEPRRFGGERASLQDQSHRKHSEGRRVHQQKLADFEHGGFMYSSNGRVEGTLSCAS